MINAEKYLKDGVDIVTFMIAFRQWYFSIERMAKPVDMTIEDFLRADFKPILTEDEKVILKKLGEGARIIRRVSRDDLYVEYCFIDYEVSKDLPYQHLFQFIQPRRRI